MRPMMTINDPHPSYFHNKNWGPKLDCIPNGRPPWPPSNPNPHLYLALLSRRLLDISCAAGSSLYCNFQNVQNAVGSSLHQGSWHCPTLVLGSFAVVRCHRKEVLSALCRKGACAWMRHIGLKRCNAPQTSVISSGAKRSRRQLLNVFLAFSLVRSCGKWMLASFMMQNSWDILRSLVVLNQTRFLNCYLTSSYAKGTPHLQDSSRRAGKCDGRKFFFVRGLSCKHSQQVWWIQISVCPETCTSVKRNWTLRVNGKLKQ